MGKTAYLTFVQKKIIDTLHFQVKLQNITAAKAGCSQCCIKNIHGNLTGR